MNKGHRACALFVILWEIYCGTTVQNCPKVELVGNISKDNVVVVEEHCDVVISVHVSTDGCEDIAHQWLLKIVRVVGERIVDECKVPLTNATCQQRDHRPETCSCLYDGLFVAKFRRTFSGSDYQVYDWILVNQTTLVKQRRIYFVIRKSATTIDYKNTVSANETKCVCLCNCLHAVTVSYVCVAIVIAIILGCIVRRHWKTNGLSSSWSCVTEPQATRLEGIPSDSIAHSQAVQSTDQLETQVNDLYDNLNRR